LELKYRQLCALLKKADKIAVAYSGGVDSSLLLKAAVDSLGSDNVTAVFARSVLQKPETVEGALSRALEFGCTVKVVDLSPLSCQKITANTPKRCYFCKKTIYEAFLEAVPGYQFVDGTNTDDLKRDRPGLQALKELRIRMPLVEISLTKKEIRVLSRTLGLATWDLPSESCLATRIPTGTFLSVEVLEKVALGERFLTGLGFQGCRVRFEEQGVVIAIHEKDFVRIAEKHIRKQIISFFSNWCHGKVLLDFSGRVEYGS
jgi:pyridinium-3,5-biscarboxylic acid mononucleotide sulfurtransferase